MPINRVSLVCKTQITRPYVRPRNLATDRLRPAGDDGRHHGGKGLDEDILRDLVHSFYARVRRDTVLGPVFAARITDWGPHLDRMVSFWSSVALMTGSYHGRPVPAHTPLPINRVHFEHWLGLFRETAQEVCTPAGAAHVIERAERIARSLHIAVEGAQAAPDAIPALG